MATHGSGNGNGRLRLLAGIVVLLLIAVVVLADIFGRLLVDDQFRISDLMLGTLLGALLYIIGIDVSRRWPFNGGDRD